MIDQTILNRLNAPTREERLANLREVTAGAEFPPVVDAYINNHIHTTYSFSPYSPAASVYAARAEGLCTAGVVDHDSIAGAREFIEAGEIVGIPTTVGMECRARMDGTILEGRRTNNPDQVNVSYMTLQGVPHDKIEYVNDWFAPRRAARNERNRKMVTNINTILPDVSLDFDQDVLPLSEYAGGGVVTERHLMYALAKKLVERVGRGQPMVDCLADLGLELGAKQREQMLDVSYPFYEYDLLAVLKSAFIPRVYVDAVEECPLIGELVSLAREVGAVLCYSYLGDVGQSVTGDKKPQKFEDDYLDDVFTFLKDSGIPAVTYMPTRNTRAQLERLRGLCEKNGLFQVSGEDINSPRQSFIIRAMEDPMFRNLIDATWRLIDYETGKRPMDLYH